MLLKSDSLQLILWFWWENHYLVNFDIVWTTVNIRLFTMAFSWGETRWIFAIRSRKVLKKFNFGDFWFGKCEIWQQQRHNKSVFWSAAFESKSRFAVGFFREFLGSYALTGISVTIDRKEVYKFSQPFYSAIGFPNPTSEAENLFYRVLFNINFILRDRRKSFRKIVNSFK